MCQDCEFPYSVIAFYIFTRIENPTEEVAKHHAFFESRDIKSRIYISEEGINAQMSAYSHHGQEYMEWLKQDPRFRDIDFKIHHHHEHVFPRIIVKYRKQLVAIDQPVDMSLTGEHLSPKDWKEKLEQRDEKTLLIDVRNDYEWEVGHFEGAELPKLKQFREFPKYAKDLAKDHDPEETTVMMYCTGGIRCELYSAVLKQEGFRNVFQLDGGVIKYGLEEGNESWKGRLFVFDDRLSVSIDPEEENELISHCRHCSTPTDVYYNCSSMDCNELFLCCSECADKLQGCCCEACMSSKRLRPYQKTDRPKPFRKWHLIRDALAKDNAS